MRRISGHSVFVLMTILIGFLAVFIALDSKAHKQGLFKEKSENAEAFTQAFLTAMRYPMMTGNQEVIQQQLTEYKSLQNINTVYLTDHAGIIRRSSEKEWLGEKSWSKFSAQAYRGRQVSGLERNLRTGEQVFSYLTPVFNEKNCRVCHGDTYPILGVLHVENNLALISADIRQLNAQHMLMTVVVLSGMAVSVGVYFFRNIARPMRALESGMQKIAKGNFDQRIAYKGNDEIREVITIFNKMSLDLAQSAAKEKMFLAQEQERAQELTRLNETLTREMQERERAEKSQREAEAKFTSVINNLGIGVALLNADMTVAAVNEQMGIWYEPMDINKKPACWQHLKAGRQEGFCLNCPVIKAFRDGQGHEAIIPVIREKEVADFRVAASPIKDKLNKVIAVVEMVEDATERCRFQRQIQEQNIFLSNIIEALAYPFCVIDANDYKVKMANAAAHNGYLPEGITCYALTHNQAQPCTGAEHECPLTIVKQEKMPFMTQHIHADKNTGLRYIEFYASPILDAQGRVKQIIEYQLDVTGRKKFEQQIMRAKEESEILYRVVPSGLFMVDRDQKITGWNNKAEQITGYKQEEVLGKHCSIFALEPCDKKC